MPALLQARGVSKSFGALVALEKVDLTLEPGEVLGVIGPNGSGKSTLFSIISGALRPDAGEIFFQGKDITGQPEYAVCRLGLVRTNQIPRPFAEMSVLDNVACGAMFGAGMTKPKALAHAGEVLDLVELDVKAERLAGALTMAQRGRLELARALAAQPKVILLDENLAGLTPTETDQGLEVLRKVKGLGVALVMVEHVMRAVKGICSRVVVLDFGRKIAEGPPEEVMSRRQVIEAYLGERYA